MSTQNGRLAGKVAIITGASTGCGPVMAKLFVEHGARVLLAALGEQGLVGVLAGIADGPFTAEQAARVAAAGADQVCVVPTGEAGAFLAPLPIATLVAAEGGATELPGLLARLGVQTLGEFSALESDRVRERFGAEAVIRRVEAVYDLVTETTPRSSGPP